MHYLWDGSGTWSVQPADFKETKSTNAVQGCRLITHTHNGEQKKSDPHPKKVSMLIFTM